MTLFIRTDFELSSVSSSYVPLRKKISKNSDIKLRDKPIKKCETLKIMRPANIRPV